MTKVSVETGDITALDVDVIVNAANETLAPGGGVCGAIHRAAGPELADECAGLGGCMTGDAKITGGYGLRARHVIHTVGPRYSGGGMSDSYQLARCHANSLSLAASKGLASIAFPAISTGIFGYPPDEAAEVAASAVAGWLRGAGETSVKDIRFVCFDAEMAAIYRAAVDDNLE